MPSPPLPLRPDFSADGLRLLAASTRGFDIRVRLLAIAAIYEGAPRTNVAHNAGICLQTLRTWVVRFNVGGPDALRNNYARPSSAIVRSAEL